MIGGGSLKIRAFGFKNPERVQDFLFYGFVANLLLAQRGRKEKNFEYLRLIMLKLSFKVSNLCLLVNLI